ncbi:MAG: A/G-specific adenine glycosylase [Candidatus Andersenbacteria bacterium]
MTIPVFQKIILEWYQKSKRDLPWRKTRNPYKILVSEIMLQQTQVSRVIPKYQQFLQEFPAPETLAKAPDSKLLTVWSGLGYWRRAKFLKATAQAITDKHNGVFPQTPEELIRLPGIGPYTAGAVACFAFNYPGAFIDTNIRRVYLHFFFPNKEEVPDKEILEIAQEAVWKENPRIWHWALFDYGATELRTKGINKRSKHYAKQSKFEGSFRSYRTAVVKKLLTSPDHQLSRATVLDFLEDKLRQEEQDYNPQEILKALQKDKLIKTSEKTISL